MDFHIQHSLENILKGSNRTVWDSLVAKMADEMLVLFCYVCFRSKEYKYEKGTTGRFVGMMTLNMLKCILILYSANCWREIIMLFVCDFSIIFLFKIQ